jgi:hypothetical protein
VWNNFLEQTSLVTFSVLILLVSKCTISICEKVNVTLDCGLSDIIVQVQLSYFVPNELLEIMPDSFVINFAPHA